MEEVWPAGVLEGKAQPTTVAQKEWFEVPREINYQICQTVAKDMTFFIKHQSNEKCSETGWTHFNQSHSNVSAEMTTVRYIPIV